VSPTGDKSEATRWLQRQANRIDEHDTLEVAEDVASAVTVEAWLQRRGIKYASAVEIPISMIDEKRSLQNQARREPLVTESVDRFANAFRAGRSFPPIVVYPLGNRLVIIDGNNRFAAAKRAHRETVFGIIIDASTDSDMIQLLTVEANASHGVTPPLEWRTRQAFHLCSLGHSDEVAAEAAGTSLIQLRNARSAAEAEQRAAILKIYGFKDLPMTAKQYLNGLKQEPVFHAVAVLAAREKLTIESVRDICRKVKSGKSEAEQLAILAEQSELLVAETAAKKALSRRLSSPKMALASGIGLIVKCDAAALVNQILTTQDRDVVNQRLREVEDKILEIQVAMETLKDMEG
jgi:ParB-like chromosome segregation protein Spo0J